MIWPFTGRTEQLDHIDNVLRRDRPGPLIVTGESGIGRTALLVRALDLLDHRRDRVIVVDVGAPRPSLATMLTERQMAETTVVPASTPAVVQAAAAATGELRARRTVFVVDDAHLAHHAVIETLRDLHRGTGAVMLLSRPSDPPPPTPDPLDCLRYEPGVRTLVLPPLSEGHTRALVSGVLGGEVATATAEALHAATAGNPGLLHDLLIGNGLAETMVRTRGFWQLPPQLGRRLDLTVRGRDRLLSAMRATWAALSFERLSELCKLALRVGAADETVPVWAFVLLLRGQAAEGLRLLDGLDQPPVEEARSVRLVTSRALLLALGLGQVDQAAELLAEAARLNPGREALLLAVRAWVLAVLGHIGAPVAALSPPGPDEDPEAAVFVRSAQALAEFAADRPRQAISHLRRAIIGADALRAELPWFAPYLTGALIDALLLAGRISEATVAAADFHAAQEGCGWDVAVSLSALINSVVGVPEPAHRDR
ncbi:ATP-binding protein [Micromonospora sp. NPDC049171]|uniref:ATP-binding protein n=1 Tax=Micromonospora sp. NPDC049171 TaxID=3155770 RepID=UPI0033C083EF